MNKVRNIRQKAGETCKSIFNWTKKIIPRVIFGAVIIILTVALYVAWYTGGISDTLYIGTIGAIVPIALVVLQLSHAEMRDKMTRAHNAKVIELIEELVKLQRAKNKN